MIIFNNTSAEIKTKAADVFINENDHNFDRTGDQIFGSQYRSEKMTCYFHGDFHFWPIFLQKKPNAESGILSGYFRQNIPSHDF